MREIYTEMDCPVTYTFMGMVAIVFIISSLLGIMFQLELAKTITIASIILIIPLMIIGTVIDLIITNIVFRD